MSVLDAVIYGVIQALCEFLPISSSGHLALLPKFLDIKDPGVTFDLYLHIGTILSLMVYFRSDLVKIAKSKIKILRQPQNILTHTGYDGFVVNMIIATVISIFFILLFKPVSEAYGRNPQVIAFCLAFFGFLLFWADRKKVSKNQVDLEVVDLKFCLQMGLAQALAIFPGVSRSGATLTMGRWLQFDRRVIAEFTFLLSIPIVAIGSVYKGLKIFIGEEVLDFDLMSAGIGILVSFILGVLVIHFFLKIIKRIPFVLFFLYRLAIALMIIG